MSTGNFRTNSLTHSVDYSLTQFRQLQNTMESASSYKESGNKLFSMKNYSAAAACYRKGIEELLQDSSSSDAECLTMEVALRGNLALMLLKLSTEDASTSRGNLHECIKECSTAIELDPSNAKMTYRRGQAHHRLGHEFDEVGSLCQAEDNFAKCIDILNKQLERCANTKEMRAMAKQIDDAMKSLEKVRTAKKNVSVAKTETEKNVAEAEAEMSPPPKTKTSQSPELGGDDTVNHDGSTQPTHYAEEELDAMSVKQLKTALGEVGLSTRNGTKLQLKNRYLQGKKKKKETMSEAERKAKYNENRRKKRAERSAEEKATKNLIDAERMAKARENPEYRLKENESNRQQMSIKREKEREKERERLKAGKIDPRLLEFMAEERAHKEMNHRALLPPDYSSCTVGVTSNCCECKQPTEKNSFEITGPGGHPVYASASVEDSTIMECPLREMPNQM